MYDKVESVSKEIGVIIGNQMETLELKSIVAKINNSLEGFKERFEQAGKRFSDPENRTNEITQTKEQKEKRMNE